MNKKIKLQDKIDTFCVLYYFFITLGPIDIDMFSLPQTNLNRYNFDEELQFFLYMLQKKV